MIQVLFVRQEYNRIPDGRLLIAIPDEVAFLFWPIGIALPLMILDPSRRNLRWLLVLLSCVLLLAHQYYFKVNGGETLFGPPSWSLLPDRLIPPVISLLFLVLLIRQFAVAVDSAEERLAAEHARAESLLPNILPEEIRLRCMK